MPNACNSAPLAGPLPSSDSLGLRASLAALMSHGLRSTDVLSSAEVGVAGGVALRGEPLNRCSNSTKGCAACIATAALRMAWRPFLHAGLVVKRDSLQSVCRVATSWLKAVNRARNSEGRTPLNCCGDPPSCAKAVGSSRCASAEGVRSKACDLLPLVPAPSSKLVLHLSSSGR